MIYGIIAYHVAVLGFLISRHHVMFEKNTAFHFEISPEIVELVRYERTALT